MEINNKVDLDNSKTHTLINTEKYKKLTLDAIQLAHDIASPLAILNIVLHQSSDALSEENKIFFEHALTRIRDISHSLLKKAKAEISEGDTVGDYINISQLMETCLSEKRFQLRAHAGIKLFFQQTQEASRAIAYVNPVEFMRALSNLINNAVEACMEEGDIAVSLSLKGNLIDIKIKDNGIGMSKHLLNKLGQLGVTSGKKHGMGLGIYHAKNSIMAWNGSLAFASQLGEGTQIEIMLPLMNP